MNTLELIENLQPPHPALQEDSWWLVHWAINIARHKYNPMLEEVDGCPYSGVTPFVDDVEDALGVEIVSVETQRLGAKGQNVSCVNWRTMAGISLMGVPVFLTHTHKPASE